MSPVQQRQIIREAYFLPEAEVVAQLAHDLDWSVPQSQAAQHLSHQWVSDLRASHHAGLMESFLAEYGLSTEEGVALMCLAEAFLRVPDNQTLDELIQDKVGQGAWAKHLQGSRSSLVNASTWALMLTGKLVTQEEEQDAWVQDQALSLIRRLGEPVVRTAVRQAMQIMGQQFVSGRDIGEAIKQGDKWRKKAYHFSYDMLGEAAMTDEEARQYFLAYSQAINALAQQQSRQKDLAKVHQNDGISIKLSALHPRYEYTHRDQVMRQLVPRLSALVELACHANLPLNIDAEESERLDLSLDVMTEVLRNTHMADWQGFGVVVQAYSKQALPVLRYLSALAQSSGRRIAVRLVKGAYWDREIKQAQVQGLAAYPVFTRKSSTDLSYLACAQYLLSQREFIYPQFATHNAHTVAAIMQIAGEQASGFEFQRLHGMGEALHGLIQKQVDVPCRIYAPVGVHRDLLAYLVRRLLENGANSSFVNQVLDEDVPIEHLLHDPVMAVANEEQEGAGIVNPHIPLPSQLFEQRINSRGLDVNNAAHAQRIEAELNPWREHQWQGQSLIAVVADDPVEMLDGSLSVVISNPANLSDQVGTVHWAQVSQVSQAIETALEAFPAWQACSVIQRADALRRIADAYEANTWELMALLIREAGKSRLDAILEIREAVDFCRYYADEAVSYAQASAKGVFVCISPWNFPLAIFTGQIVAALVAGNTVVAKPAESTNLIATRAVQLMHEAGIPEVALSLVLGHGRDIGALLSADARIAGLCFTGSGGTARHIDQALASNATPEVSFIAETGGVNAMIVDSTALPQQAVRDIVASAFQSAGQRCSALRVLLVQQEVFDDVTQMLMGAMRALCITQPWQEQADLGAVINQAAKEGIEQHVSQFEQQGQLLYRTPVPKDLPEGYYVAPSLIRLNTLAELEQEVFGPVLHILPYQADELNTIIDSLNASGYHLTLGMHSRIGARIDLVCKKAKMGNIYINRNQIGAVVGVQPFGGDALSGTGPKAGGAWYLHRFMQALPEQLPTVPELAKHGVELPGPTGETNTWFVRGRGVVLCLGNGSLDSASQDWVLQQLKAGLQTGNQVLCSEDWQQDAAISALQQQYATAMQWCGQHEALLSSLAVNVRPDVVLLDQAELPIQRQWRMALAALEGQRTPLVSLRDGLYRLMSEQTVSVDTTATGGNAALLAL